MESHILIVDDEIDEFSIWVDKNKKFIAGPISFCPIIESKWIS